MATSIQTELPIAFYNNPDTCRSLFSTRCGEVSKRSLELPLQAPIVYSNLHQAIDSKAAELQRNFPEEVWFVEFPADWSVLYHWFDAHDIHAMGASFLIQVLRKVCEQNETANKEMLKVIDEAAIDWVNCNIPIVAELPFDQEMISFVAAEELDGLKPREMVMFSQALNKHRHLFHSLPSNSMAPPPSPSDIMPLHVPPSRAVPESTGAFAPAQSFFSSADAAGERRPADLLARPPPQQTRTVERLIYGLRTSAAIFHAEVDVPRHDHRRPRRMSNDPSRQNQSPYPRRLSQPRDQRPRGHSTAIARNGIEGPRGGPRRHSSNHVAPDTSTHELIYVFNGQRTLSSTSPPKQQSFKEFSTVLQGSAQTPRKSPEDMQQSSQVSGYTPIARQKNFGSAPSPSYALAGKPTMPPQDARVHSQQYVPNYQRNFVQSSPAGDNRNLQAYHNHRISSSSSVFSNSGTTAYQARSEQLVHDPPNKPGDNRVFNTFLRNSGVISHAPNGSKTVTFNGLDRRENRDESGQCTMFIRDLSAAFFDSYDFKALLARSGEVSDMTHCPNGRFGPERGTGFIHFASPEAAARAIHFFSEYTPADGIPLYAKFATPKGPWGNRIPNRPNNFYENQTYGRDSVSIHRQNNNRRPSIHNPAQVYRPHQYSNQQSRAQSPGHREPLIDGFQQQLISATVKMEHTALARMVPVFGDVSNLPKTDIQPPPGFAVLPKKENLPIKPVTGFSPASLSKWHAQHNQSGSSESNTCVKNRKKGGKRTANSSLHGTPSATPTKSKPSTDARTLSKEESKPNPLKIITDVVADANNHRKLHDGQNKRTSRSAVCEPQNQKIKTLTSPASESSTVNTPSITFFTSTVPSRDLSVASMSSLNSSFHPTTNPESNKCSLSTELTHISKKVEFRGDTISKESQTQSEPSAKSENDLREGETSSNMDENAQSQPTKDWNKKNKTNFKNQGLDPMGYHSSLTEPGNKAGVEKKEKSSPVSDALQATKYHTETRRGLTTKRLEPEFRDAQKEDSPRQEALRLKDSSQFPSLGPSSSPLSSIADGKRPDPPTVMTPINNSPTRLVRSTQRTQSSQSLNGHSKVVVAVPMINPSGQKPGDQDVDDECDEPLSMPLFSSKIRQQKHVNTNMLGSRDWPFVKRFREA